MKRKPTKEDLEQYEKDLVVYKEKMNIVIDTINEVVKKVTDDANPVVAHMIDQNVASFFIALSLANAPGHVRPKLLEHMIKDAKRMVKSIKPEMLRSMH